MNDPATSEASALIQRVLNRYTDSSRHTAANLRLQLSGASQVSLTRWLFLRLLALVFLIAFLSFWIQAAGLVGGPGDPAGGTDPADGAGRPARCLPARAVPDLPDPIRWGAALLVTVCCAVGMVAALAAMAGVAAPLCSS